MLARGIRLRRGKWKEGLGRSKNSLRASKHELLFVVGWLYNLIFERGGDVSLPPKFWLRCKLFDLPRIHNNAVRTHINSNMGKCYINT